jgi:TolB-like protein
LRLGVGSVVLLALVAVAVFARPAAPPVLVLFEHDYGADAAAAELASDLATQLTTTLTATFPGRLAVIGPTGSAMLAGPNDTEGARAELRACLVLSGAARIVGPPPGRVVVFTQIVRTSDRVHVWASQDTTSMADAVVGVLPRIVEGVREALVGC